MVDALRYIDFGLIGLSGKFQGKDSSLLPNRQWNQRQKHKKQPWSNVECFAFGGATVRFASLETNFAPRIKTARRFTAKNLDDNMISCKEVVSNLPNDFVW